MINIHNYFYFSVERSIRKLWLFEIIVKIICAPWQITWVILTKKKPNHWNSPTQTVKKIIKFVNKIRHFAYVIIFLFVKLYIEVQWLPVT